MQFYQKRDFGTIVSDTFTFFKNNGKNYFKNYIFINGFILILMMVIFVFGYRELFSQMLGSNTEGQNYFLQTYFEENSAMLILVSSLVFILFLAVTIVSYSYPILYLKRLSETGNKNIKADELLRDIKNNFGRFIKLLLGLVFVVTPLAFFIVGLSYLLIFVLIGFFIMLLVIPTLMNIVNFLMFDYFHTKKSFFQSLSYAMRAQFSYPNGNDKTPFWKYWGSTAIMYLIIQVITSVFTMIPMVFIFIKIFAMEESGNGMQENPFSGTMGILFFLVYGVSIMVTFLLMNFIFVSSGLQYYDSRTDLHRTIDFTEIDTIGTHER